MARGLFVAVVGPSGVGKDTILDGLKAALAADADVVFVRRHITRPAEAGGEAHHPVSWESFEQTEAAGGYALSWRAHDLGYGIPKRVLSDLAQGRTVIANLSRSALGAARALGFRTLVVSVVASPETLRARLAARGREAEDEIAARLARAEDLTVDGSDVFILSNDASPEAAVAALSARLAAERKETGA